MKFTFRILIASLATLSFMVVGCGPRATDPKPITVKEDPRVQPVGISDGKKSNTQGEAPK